APALGVRGGAVIVDHRLQPGSDVVAEKAAEQCRELGLDPVEVVAVTVPRDGSGPEAAARTARYAALDEAADRLGATAILLGHTRDDQAEQVLLGLLRGSGARALAGMPPTRGRYVRPFLELPRSVTLEACDAWGVTPWRDPHNDDPNYARVRARRALVVLTEELGADPRVALARSAAQLRADADYLDAEAAAALSRFEVMATAGAVPNTSNRGEVGTVPVGDLAALPTAIRTRVWRSLLLTHGAPAGQLAHTHIAACDRLLTQWTGQGPIHVPGPLQVRRSAGRIEIAALR
ncbi:tRNA lysidine(34) synthetase TilS, partial [Kribbia dieselivorans]|uniref:tRNA lysidine(34) synthetase TilS n=1 Tax=Kribbia dieselivorans TaxID=331526 RepID=UPI000837CB69